MPRLAVIFTGGTISMRSTPTGSGNAPGLGAEQLLQTVPGIERIAEVEPVDWGLVPGSHLTFEQVLVDRHRARRGRRRVCREQARPSRRGAASGLISRRPRPGEYTSDHMGVRINMGLGQPFQTRPSNDCHCPVDPPD